jgi:hypothetical protein
MLIAFVSLLSFKLFSKGLYIIDANINGRIMCWEAYRISTKE